MLFLLQVKSALSFVFIKSDCLQNYVSYLWCVYPMIWIWHAHVGMSRMPPSVDAYKAICQDIPSYCRRRPGRSRQSCVWHSDTLTRFFARYRFVTYVLTYLDIDLRQCSWTCCRLFTMEGLTRGATHHCGACYWWWWCWNVICGCMLATDERILPSTDSQSDLAFDDDSLPPCHDAPLSQPADKLSLSYARCHAFQATPFVQPSDSEARPLQDSSTEAAAVGGGDGCHGE